VGVNHPCIAPHTCKAYPIAILLHAYFAIYAPPSTLFLYAIHYTILAMAISCKGQLAIHSYPMYPSRVQVADPLPAGICVGRPSDHGLRGPHTRHHHPTFCGGQTTTSKAFALTWYRALTWYSSPARPFAAPDVPLFVTGQQGSPSPACRPRCRARNTCAGSSSEESTKLRHGTKLGRTLCYRVRYRGCPEVNPLETVSVDPPTSAFEGHTQVITTPPSVDIYIYIQ